MKPLILRFDGLTISLINQTLVNKIKPVTKIVISHRKKLNTQIIEISILLANKNRNKYIFSTNLKALAS